MDGFLTDTQETLHIAARELCGKVVSPAMYFHNVAPEILSFDEREKIFSLILSDQKWGVEKLAPAADARCCFKRLLENNEVKVVSNRPLEMEKAIHSFWQERYGIDIPFASREGKRRVNPQMYIGDDPIIVRRAVSCDIPHVVFLERPFFRGTFFPREAHRVFGWVELLRKIDHLS